MIRNIFVNMDRKKAIVIAMFFTVVIILALNYTGILNSNNKTIKTTNEPQKVLEQTLKPTVESTIEPTLQATEESHEGQAKSRLTGKWIDEALAAKRPYAVMFNNIKVASPQSGTSECDILLEAVVEGGITRIMGVTQKFTTDRIGSIRSARPYFVDFCKDFDAIYIHMGGSDDAKAKIKNIGIADLDGTGGIGNTLIYRDNNINAPHNAFSSISRITKSINSKGFRMDYQGVDNNFFTFNDKATSSESGKDANKVIIKFSSYTTPYFEYDSNNKVYGRYQFDKKHVDYNTGKQLTFTNIVIMYVKQWSLDSKDRQAMDISDSSGAGYYVSQGKSIDIKWTRDGEKNKTQFLDSNGKLLSINPGKTYIAVVPVDNKSATTIK